MIDQIAHLIEQAEASADAEYALRRTGYSREDIFRQHFAELIVRECAHVGFNAAYPGAGVEVKLAIEQHFGLLK